MLFNFIKTATRNILREKQYALIKIGGLALGLGTSLVLLLYISDQLSYDNMHPDGDRIYRVNQTNIWDPAGGVFSSTGPAVSFALKSDFPEIESVVRINTPGGQIVRYQPVGSQLRVFDEGSVLAADSTFFQFFNFKLKAGDPSTALNGQNKVILSDKAARRLFGEEQAIGKIIEIGDTRIPVEVTGVTEAQPSNIHFHFDYLLSMYTNPNIKEFEWSWIWTQVVTYVKLRPDANVAALGEKLKVFADRHAPATFKRVQMDYKEWIQEKGAWILYLQPLRDLHLHSNKVGNRIGPSGNVDYIYALGIIAGFILLIAVVNFINLSTARGSKRAKEVGVKKTLGVARASLITQFQVEHILLTFVSMLLGLGVMELLRLSIQPFVGVDIPLSTWSPLTYALVTIFFPLVIGFLGGLYPAFYLTSFRPAQVLKGRIMSGFGSPRLRNTLVVFQFSISIALMAATLIVFQQLNFFQSQGVGFEKENLVVINNADKLNSQMESYREEVSRMPGVITASLSNDIDNGFEDVFVNPDNGKQLTISAYKTDEYFMGTMKLKMAAGRTFDADRPSDVNAVVINQTTARLCGWTDEQALGKRIAYLGDDVGPQEIIGVVSDFHFSSFRQKISAEMFMNGKSRYWRNDRILVVRYRNIAGFKDLISKIESRWNQLIDLPFAYTIYEDEVKMQYQQEQRMASLFSVFTTLSITIAVTGLIGLVAYSAEQRKKEIGIRKVFGASLTSIYVMINTQYVKLLLVALLLATPATWWLMQQWLDSFPYKITINPLIFFVAGVAELALSLLCVGYLAMRAAMLNPSTVLKDE